MHVGLFITSKVLLLVALILFCHDMLEFLKYDIFQPTTPLELWQLFFEGTVRRTYTTGSTFFDTLVSSPSWLVFGIIGALLYILFRSSGKKFS